MILTGTLCSPLATGGESVPILSFHFIPSQVAHYLVRLEPFSSLAIALQGGRFDHPDRLFLDVAATWDGVTSDMSDVKELVSESVDVPIPCFE